jgi:hypothetical protein
MHARDAYACSGGACKFSALTSCDVLSHPPARAQITLCIKKFDNRDTHLTVAADELAQTQGARRRQVLLNPSGALKSEQKSG